MIQTDYEWEIVIRLVKMTIIAFISQKGGVGKSTLAQALAVEAKKQKIKVLLTDCDIQQATSYEWSKIQGKIDCQVFKQVKDIWPYTKNYQLIIIDAPARTSQGTLEIAQKADLIIQPTGASRADLVPAVKEFNALKKAGIPTKKLLFIPFRLSTETEAQLIKEYLKKTGYVCSSYYIMEKTSYKQIQNEGKSITETKYKKLAKQVRELVHYILKKAE
jgi:chromosome partitioning protein